MSTPSSPFPSLPNPKEGAAWRIAIGSRLHNCSLRPSPIQKVVEWIVAGQVDFEESIDMGELIGHGTAFCHPRHRVQSCANLSSWFFFFERLFEFYFISLALILGELKQANSLSSIARFHTSSCPPRERERELTAPPLRGTCRKKINQLRPRSGKQGGAPVSLLGHRSIVSGAWQGTCDELHGHGPLSTLDGSRNQGGRGFSASKPNRTVAPGVSE
ncbi:hypothetical protein GQ53DRAFT_523622 [Thozetella sp. PMI_491]|nr:hypothetical protein GQ53DRAFT_523622 [Thozetella sp. PMI_491]